MSDHKRTAHQHVEHVSRSPLCLVAVAILMAVAAVQADRKVLGEVVKEAYTDGLHEITEHMREETTRMPVRFGNAIRIPNISGR